MYKGAYILIGVIRPLPLTGGVESYLVKRKRDGVVREVKRLPKYLVKDRRKRDEYFAY